MEVDEPQAEQRISKRCTLGMAKLGRNVAVSVRNLTAEYHTRRGRKVTALENLSFDVYEGEFVSIIGPSGCGKSTLLKVVSGLLPATSGEVYIKGRKIVGPGRDVGMAFQSPNLLPWRTAVQNVLLPIEILGLDIKDYTEKTRDLLKLVGLEGFEDKDPRHLSGGMQQRVSLCRALIYDPSLLLLDEPFGALDAMTREEMNLELLRIWSVKKKTVLFVTHSIPESAFLSDRVLVLSRRPGTLIHVEEVSLHRPRSLEMMASQRFLDHTNVLREKIGAKVVTE